MEKKEQRRALDVVVVALIDADLFYFVFLQIPRIHAAKFQLLDKGTRNAKWVTIKAGRDDDAEKKGIIILTCTCAAHYFSS